MRPVHPILALACLALCVSAVPSPAGQNAGATARLYWQVGDGPGIAGRNADSAVVQLLVTVRGVRSFRGADVQLGVAGPAGGLPGSWQLQEGGCGEKSYKFEAGGAGGAYPNLFRADPRLPGQMDLAPRAYYHHRKNPCLTPDSSALVWFTAAGREAVRRDSTVEYAVLSVRFDLRAGACWASDSAAAPGVCVYGFNHFPCQLPIPRASITLVDAGAVKDYIPLEPGFERLTWRGGACPAPWQGPLPTPSPGTGGGPGRP
ncbi:MAG: hypothetical protein HZB25_07385 [Candidatus Eisenbacteria bacterium]|nr:hypothetical protein [Candidatus Eisenbacteria bacterium]